MAKLDKTIKLKSCGNFKFGNFHLTHLRQMFYVRENQVLDLHLQWVKFFSANPLTGLKTNFTFSI